MAKWRTWTTNSILDVRIDTYEDEDLCALIPIEADWKNTSWQNKGISNGEIQLMLIMVKT